MAQAGKDNIYVSARINMEMVGHLPSATGDHNQLHGSGNASERLCASDARVWSQ